MQKEPKLRSGSSRSALADSDALPRARMAAFAVVFVLAVVLGLILGAGISSLAIASIAGGVASIGVERGWHFRAGRRKQ